METLTFDVIYTKYHKNILTYIICKNISYDVAQELTNDTFMKAYKALSTFDSSKSNIKTWLTNIAHNAIIDYVRSEKLKRSSEISMDEMIDVEGHESLANTVSFLNQKSVIKTDYKIENQQFMNRLKAVICRLPKMQREVADLFLLNDVPQVEIAKIMNIPINTVKGNITRIRENVGKHFEAEKIEYGFVHTMSNPRYKAQ